jgi:hypothetical protein
MTGDEVMTAALAEPDAHPLTQEPLARMKRGHAVAGKACEACIGKDEGRSTSAKAEGALKWKWRRFAMPILWRHAGLVEWLTP